MDQWVTLQGINISHLGKRKIIFKMPFWGDMLVSWRVVHLRISSWWLQPTPFKNIRVTVNMDISSPGFRGENKKIFRNHQLVIHGDVFVSSYGTFELINYQKLNMCACVSLFLGEFSH